MTLRGALTRELEVVTTSAQQQPNPWPLTLAGTAHVRPCIVIARDPQADTFAIRAQAGGPVTNLNRTDAFLFEQIRTDGVQAVLKSKFGSSHGTISIESTMALVLKLHEKGLLETVSNQDLMKSLEMLAAQDLKGNDVTKKTASPGPTIRFNTVMAHPAISVFVAAVFLAVFRNPISRMALSLDSLTRQLETPALTLGALWFAILGTSTIYSLCAQAMTQGTLPPMLQSQAGLSFERRAIFFLLAKSQIASIEMLTRRQEMRIRFTLLFLPWAAAGVAAIASNGTNVMLTTLAIAFSLIGLRETSPLDRGQLVSLLEAYYRKNNLLESTRHFLRKGLLRFDHKIAGGEGVLATTMIAWLAALSIYGSDILISSVYELGNHATALINERADGPAIINALASAAWLLMLGTVALGGIIRLISIPFENAFSLASIPLKALRPKALLSMGNKLTPQALQNILQNLPLFSDLTGPIIIQAIANSQIRSTSAGASIIKQNDPGHEFHIILEGNFLVEAQDEKGQIITTEKLVAGDTFGETALLQNRPRSATVKSIGSGILMTTSEVGFELLFPKGSKARENLTFIVRAIKLLQESEALSYLTPSQTLAIARSMQPRLAKAGDVLIREGDSHADCAILIESGSVNVTLRGQILAAKQARGILLGTTALIQNSARTASITCLEDTVYLEISRGDFLEACGSNVVIAILLGSMTQRQLESQSSIHAHEATAAEVGKAAS